MRKSLCLFFIAFSCVSGCTRPDSSVPPTIARAVSGRPGLSAAERAEFYHLEEGSELFPVTWFLALESENGTGLFTDNLDRFGLIPDARSATNPFGLPVGLTAAETRDLKHLRVKMLGINCAACHVAELTFNGNRMRLDGAPARFDTSAFYTALATAVLRTIDLTDGPERLIAFIRRRAAGDNPLLGATESARSARLQPALAGLQADTPSAAFDEAFKNQLTDLLRAEAARPPVDLNADVVLKPDSPRLAAAMQRMNAELSADLATTRLMRAVPSPSPPSAEMQRAGQPAELRSSILPAFVKDAITTFRLLKARVAFLMQLNAVDGTRDLPPGYGRLDAFGGARNLLWRTSARAQTAPVSYPDLWSFDTLDWVHWDGNTTSVLERNIGQALGLGAVLDRSTKISTVSVVNLHALEVMAMKIQPPRWDETVLGAIDRSRAARGKTLFDRHCSECHVQKAGKEFAIADIGGVDPNRAVNFTATIDGRPNNDVIAELMRQVKLKAYEEKGLTPAQRAELERGRLAPQWRAHEMYIARPLVAIWASAPYLHNNSVPTLHDLLLPAAQRPSVFFTGHAEYDPANVGLRVTDDGARRFRFDTSLSGNRNTGHEYGTALADGDRRDLLEYLKTF
jgi:hypothetical protein